MCKRKNVKLSVKYVSASLQNDSTDLNDKVGMINHF